ncbi:Nitrate reductase (NADH) [Lasiodiplodia theobromae]|uniref:Nitrate reductase [NADPH] n=1 Tax=Lasiodiplodia theobromae TaxID=45133 RepID=A0A5N5DJ71_9PEZI|nr:Nitrate reductase (NADH) [Lasiodiplodia theobromae]
MPPIPWTVKVRHHPGSSADDVAKEPDWGARQKRYIGFKDGQDHKVGITHQEGEYDGGLEIFGPDPREVKSQAMDGEPITLRDVIRHSEMDPAFMWKQGANSVQDFPENNILGWRHVFETSESCGKGTEEFPMNVEAKQIEGNPGKFKSKPETNQQEHEWRRSRGENKHNAAYSGVEDTGYDSGIEQSGPTGFQDPEPDNLTAKYTPQEIALLRSVRHEREYISQLRVDDGKGISPHHERGRTQISTDERDQLTPDNWIPRSWHLTRLTGKHPLNAEPRLSSLFDAGLITPNELHYVRNHGPVPRLLWERHILVIQGGKLTLSMDELKNRYSTINIPVMLASAGNRRKELNMAKRSKGFDWGAGAVGCAFWKGPLLRDVLLAAGVSQSTPQGNTRRFWVHFEGAGEPSEGKYATCLSLEYAMDPKNDVLLAMEMNDVPLPPDQGYPVRLVVPGHIGERSVKWLERIWVSDRENDSYYHIWDNRLLPSFVVEKDGEFADALFHLRSTACNEQTLNSVIVKPAHGERIPLSQAQKGQSYRISGYAYDGGGHEVQRVEVSLDGGDTWLYCIRQYPDYPIRHGHKFWTWLHWHIDVELSHLLRAKSITVRGCNVFKITQPQKADWNVLGLMNNGWYVLRTIITDSEDSDVPSILFQHPVEPGTANGGWMRPSMEDDLRYAGRQITVPQKQFTREEIERHDKDNDCWIVIDGRVYDVTSVLSWHPGGKVAILGHAGKAHQETSDEFASIHDAYAYRKLEECILGNVTDKVASLIKKNATLATEARTYSRQIYEGDDSHLTLRKSRWVPIRLVNRQNSANAHTYTFALPDGQSALGLGTCQYLQLGFHLPDRMLIRSYTPTRPLLPAFKHSVHHNDQHAARPASPSSPVSPRSTRPPSIPGPYLSTASNTTRRDSLSYSLRDGLDGTFDITVPAHPPPPPPRSSSTTTAQQPSTSVADPFLALLAQLPLGSTAVSCRGPLGSIVYNGCGAFAIGAAADDDYDADADGREIRAAQPSDQQPSSSFFFSRISLVLAGGPEAVARGYALIARVLLCADPTPVHALVVVASSAAAASGDGEEKGESFLKEELEAAVERGKGQVSVASVAREKVMDDAEVFRRELFGPGEGAGVFVCGEAGLVNGWAVPALKDWGYEEGVDMFGL